VHSTEPQYTLTVDRQEAFGIIATLKKLPMDQIEVLVGKLTDQVVRQEQDAREAEIKRLIAEEAKKD